MTGATVWSHRFRIKSSTWTGGEKITLLDNLVTGQVTRLLDLVLDLDFNIQVLKRWKVTRFQRSTLMTFLYWRWRRFVVKIISHPSELVDIYIYILYTYIYIYICIYYTYITIIIEVISQLMEVRIPWFYPLTNARVCAAGGTISASAGCCWRNAAPPPARRLHSIAPRNPYWESKLQNGLWLGKPSING